MHWLFGKDELGVRRYWYVLFWIVAGFAMLGNFIILLSAL